MAVRSRGVARGLRALAARLALISTGPSPESLAFHLFPAPQAAFSRPAAPAFPHPHRLFSDAAQPLAATPSDDLMPEHDFHQLCDHTLDDMCERLEEWLEGLDMDDSDIEHSQGVVTLKLGALGTYVINKQTPNRQIWMSSPVSGPVRYDYHKGGWVYRRDGHAMHARLASELEALTGVAVDLNPCSSCNKLNACVEGNYCLK